MKKCVGGSCALTGASVVFAAAFLCTFAGSATAQTWPFPGARTVTSSFGDDENNSVHGGLDIPAAAGTNVRAVRGFTITTLWYRDAMGNPQTSSMNGFGGGRDVFQVMGTDANGRTHLYAHLQNPALGNITVGQPVAEGGNFARVRGGGVAFGGTFDHIHYNFSNNGPATAFGAWLDPLQSVFGANTVTEQVRVNHMTFQPRSGQFPIYAQHLSARESGRFIKGGVNMIAEITDDMGDRAREGATVADPRGTTERLYNGIIAVPTEVRYEVAKPDYLPRGTIASRTLVNFNQTDGTHAAQLATIYDAARAVTPDGSNTYNYNFNVSQTNGTGPSNTNFWKTNAKKTGAGALGDGSTRADATNNADGAFPDGLYDTATGGRLLNGTYAPTVFRALVNNWNQTALPADQGSVIPAAGGASTETQPGSENTISPPPMMNFGFGDDLFVMGSNYVDSLTYNAFVFPFEVTWAHGTALTMPIATSMISADATGTINSQPLWDNINQAGLFNIVIDYDNDGYFSWTLDGLGSFEVVPAPGASLVLAMGLSAMLRRGRREQSRGA